MKNPLLVPEIREMLEKEQFDEIRNLFQYNVPQITAGFLEAMETEEIFEIFSIIPHDISSEIFQNFEEETRALIIEKLPDKKYAELLFHMSKEIQAEFLNILHEDKRRIIKNYITQKEERSQKEEPRTESCILPESQICLHGNLGNLTIFKTNGGELCKIDRIEKNCWINLISPTSEEISYLSDYFNIPVDFFTAPLDVDERARIEKENDATLITIRVPFMEEVGKDTIYGTMAMGIIICREIIITISSKENLILEDFMNSKVKKFNTGKRDQFILKFFLKATHLFLLYLKQINNITSVIQKKIQEASKNEQLIKMLNIEKSLVYFTTSLKSNDFMMFKLKKSSLILKNEENEDMIEDIEIENKQAIEMSNIYSNIMSNMMGSFASIISNNMNIVMKFLASVTIIMTIPLLISSFYGMNVELPLAHSHYAFPILAMISVILSILLIYVFRKKNWF